MRFETLYEKVETIGGLLAITLKSGRVVMFSDAQSEAADNLSSVVRWTSRMIKLAGNAEWIGEHNWRQVEYMADELEGIAKHLHDEVRKHAVNITKRERIAQLRNTSGRTAEEAALYNAKADELERDL